MPRTSVTLASNTYRNVIENKYENGKLKKRGCGNSVTREPVAYRNNGSGGSICDRLI